MRWALTKPLTLLIVPILILSAVAMTMASEDDDAVTTTNITFDSNYPSGSNTTKTMTLVSKSTIELPTKIFSKDGYILTGWALSPGGSVAYSAGQIYNVPAGNTTLYAKWTAIPTWDKDKLQFYDVAPSTGSVKTLYSHVETNETNNDAWRVLMAYANAGTGMYNGIELSSDSPSWLNLDMEFIKTGLASGHWEYTFEGSPPSPGNYIVKVKSISKGGEGLWWMINVPANTDSTYTVDYDLDGGSGLTPAQHSNVPYGTAVVLSGAFVGTTEITKNGKILAGWDITDEFGVSSTHALGSIYAVSRNVTATAHWEVAPNVIVFSMDGGSLENVDAFVTYDGELYSLPTTSNAGKDGHTLIGWRPTGDPFVSYAPGYLVTIDGQMKLEAYFISNSSLSSLCTVNYDYAGGTGNISTQKVESGMYVYLPQNGMQKPGYIFDGWSYYDGGPKIESFDILIDSDTTLYALWKSTEVVDPEPETPPVWRVIFDSNGGNTSVPVQNVADGGFLEQPGGVIKEGHVLSGWYSETLNRVWDFQSDRVEDHMVLRAQWDRHFSYSVEGLTVTVTVYGAYADNSRISWGDGTSVDNATGTAIHTYGGVNSSSRITVTSTVGGVQYTSSLPLSGLEGGHELEKITYTVRFVTDSDHEPTEVKVEHGKMVERPEDPVREGYTFVEWCLAGATYDFSLPVTSDMTLIASWKDSSGTIDPGEDPDKPIIIYPAANGKITNTENGWRLDASESVNAVSFAWYVDSKLVSNSKIFDLGTMAEGTHTVNLIVFSSTGERSTWSDEFTVIPEEGSEGDKTDDGEEKSPLSDWIVENSMIICIAILGVMAIAFIGRSRI